MTSDDPKSSPAHLSLSYVFNRLNHALAMASSHLDPATRDRSEDKARQWLSVASGALTGRLKHGARAPVKGTPIWVTPKVIHGGFTTGELLAEGKLLPHEEALLERLPDVERQARSERACLNHWYLSDEGLQVLGEALERGTFRIDVPEEGALVVVAALLEQGLEENAFKLIEVLKPWMSRLRFYPRIVTEPFVMDSCARVASVRSVKQQLAAAKAHAQVSSMNEALLVWGPLFDRLVTLWLETVEGDVPTLIYMADGELERGSKGQSQLIGGWPCRLWPEGWAARRSSWLEDYELARSEHQRCGKHMHPRSNFSRLYSALLLCPEDSSKLSPREVGLVRRALANTIAKHGLPSSAERRALRAEQAQHASRPTHQALALLAANRLNAYPDEEGLTDLERVTVDTQLGESTTIPAGTPLTLAIKQKLSRALEAPVVELIERGVIPSCEILSAVAPQATAKVVAMSMENPAIQGLYAQLYVAFHRRRSVLLTSLGGQARLDELPWISALIALNSDQHIAKSAARGALEELSMLALSSFPQTILPNPFVKVLKSIAKQATLKLPLLEEIAADIFRGVFQSKWSEAALLSCELLEGTLYARYYDLPSGGELEQLKTIRQLTHHKLSVGFNELCNARAAQLFNLTGRGVADSGVIIEQSQILTTHNLATLVQCLSLSERIRPVAAELASRVFTWVLQQQARRDLSYKARLSMLKNTAYAWRQAIFFLSFCPPAIQENQLIKLGQALDESEGVWARRFERAYYGLKSIQEGARFDKQGKLRSADGREGQRFLGWTVGPHWLDDDSHRPR